MKTIAFFNNKGGVGKTTLLYHLAWMFAQLGVRTVAVDLDPQSNLTSMFLNEDRLEELWEGPGGGQSIAKAVAPLLVEGTGDVAEPHLEEFADNLALVPGDFELARLEEELSVCWSSCLVGNARAFRMTSALHRAINLAATKFNADLALIDIGPNLGALNRSALIAADHVIVPLVPDLVALQGLRQLGSSFQNWRNGWTKRLAEAPPSVLDLPKGEMRPAGYVVNKQHVSRANIFAKAYWRWADRIPAAYADAMGLPGDSDLSLDNDPHCLAQLKHYRSLMPMAMEARKPIFRLTPADGAIGAHASAVADCGRDFEKLARALAASTGLSIP